MKHELALRRSLLAGAVVCWVVSLTLSWLIIDKVINQVKTPGVGLVVFMAQGLAITLTIVWSQFRFRRVMVDVMRAGLRIGLEEERGKDGNEAKLP